MSLPDGRGALGLAALVRSGAVTAQALVQRVFDTVQASDAEVNACTAMFGERALQEAARIDAAVAAGDDPGPLAGVPFLVKANLDVAGQVTVAGSPTRLDAPAAARDAAVVARLRAAGAIPVGATHMDEFACGATGINPHFGAVRLPQDTARMTGGSSSGSAAAVAAGYVPFALGSDTNGSIRAPAALCGVWGIKPTYGRVSTSGCVPYARSLDVVGGFANDVDDLQRLYEVIAGECVGAPPSTRLRVVVLTGDFARHANARVQEGVQRAAASFVRQADIPLDEAAMAQVRAAAVVISNYEVARQHRALLTAPTPLVSPKLRSRLTTGLALTDEAYAQALALRNAWRAQMLTYFRDCDVLIAPATPYAAPRFDEATVDVNGIDMVPAQTLGMLTQPISLAGLPVVSAPVATSGTLPVGVQLIAAPGREALCFAAARQMGA